MRRIIGLALFLVACPSPGVDPGTTDGGSAPDGMATTDAVVQPDATPLLDAGPPDEDATADAGTDDDASVADANSPDATAADAAERVIDIRVAYTASAEDPGLVHLYLTETSTTRARLTPVLAGGSNVGGKGEPILAGVRNFAWMAEGDRIVYAAQQETYDFYELFLADDLTSTPTTAKLSLPGGASAVTEWDLSSGDAWLAFHQTPFGETRGQRFVIQPRRGATATQISVGTAFTSYWAPNAQQLVFQDILVSANDRDLWHVDLDVTPPVRTRVNPGANLGFGGAVSWSADGTQLAYSADETALRLFELWRVQLTGASLGTRERVTPPFPPTADIIGSDQIKYAPVGTMLAYLANVDLAAVKDLYVVNSADALPITPTKLTPIFPAGARGVREFEWNRAGTRIAYVADQDTAGSDDLYIHDLSGAAALRVSSPDGQPTHAVFFQNDTKLLFTQEVSNVRHTFVMDVSTTPFGAPIDLGPVQGYFPAARFALSPSERFLIHPTGESPERLIISDLTGTPTVAAAVQTYSELFSIDATWCWAPDDRLLVIGADGVLYLVEDLSGPTLFPVSGPLVADGRVTGCAFPPEPPPDK